MIKTLSCPEKTNKVCKRLIARDARRDEKKSIMKLLEGGFPSVYERERDFWEDLIDTNPDIALEMNGDLVGISSVRRPQFMNNKSVSWIDLITVSPSYQQMGLGSELLSLSEKVMKEMGAKKGRLWTEVDNTPAVAFYSKYGWKVLERTEWGYQHGHRLTMEKTL